VLSIALGIAVRRVALFGVSFALGAFFAGMILSESELSHQAAQETLPLRDAFAVLFFVSVGMLLDPVVLMDQFWPLLATLGIILFGKSVAAFAIVRLFRYPKATALVISASLAQIGEFSFILAGLGLALGVLSGAGAGPGPGRRHHLDPAQSGRSSSCSTALRPRKRRRAKFRKRRCPRSRADTDVADRPLHRGRSWPGGQRHR
jgi:Kef-type K+ transport system membrane component KefB